jgi:3-oxoacyl-(acyl-carrier-protein) synthase
VAGASAIEYACRRIALGKEGRLLAGGAEALSESVFHAYCLRGGLSASGQPRPYDPASDGMVLGEGAAVFALENDELAREWSDPVFARVRGWASCREGDLARGTARAMREALDDAGIGPEAVDLVLGAACGLPEFDAAEAAAIARVFGAARPAVTSVKGLLGEGMGAGGPMSLAAALACLDGHFAPPASGSGSPPLGGLRLIAGEAHDLRVHIVLLNAVDPGGACLTLVVGAP